MVNMLNAKSFKNVVNAIGDNEPVYIIDKNGIGIGWIMIKEIKINDPERFVVTNHKGGCYSSAKYTFLSLEDYYNNF